MKFAVVNLYLYQEINFLFEKQERFWNLLVS